MSLALPARYRHLRPLGRGGMGEVHLVFDAERGAELALKAYAPPQDTAEARAAFRQEFGAMATLAHPNLVAAFDYGELPDGRPFFTMEAVAGQDVGEALPQDEAAVLAWLPQVAAGLAFLHARGFVHGDLNPGNVRLLPDGTAKLMDLGLLTRAGASGGPVRGTLAYLAPEVARSGAVDGRADLYALGGVLFHALAGRVPFPSEDPIALLKAHLNEAPPALAALAPAVSKPLESAVMRLLAKGPESRFPTAGALLEALGLAAELPESKGLLAAPLVGRDADLARVSALWGDAGPTALWAHGPAGVGKSRLLAEARALAQLAGRPTQWVAGLGPDAAPYAAWRPALQALWASAPAPLRQRLGPILVKLLPELGFAPAEALEGSQERTRLQQAACELAATVAPNLAWLVDDRERLDDASAALLGTLRARPETAWRWLVASEGEPPATEEAEALPLLPLDEAQTALLAAALLGQSQAPAAVLEALGPLAGGLPGAVEAVLGHWVRSGAMARAAGRWEAEAGADFSLPGGWQAAQDARVEALGEAAQALAMGAALVGPSGPVEAALAAAQIAPEALFGALAEAEQAEVLQAEGGAFRFLRPALATALSSRWAPEDAAAAQGRIAQAFMALAGGRPDAPQGALGDRLAAARHGLRSAQPLSAAPWAAAACQQALSLYALSGLEGVLDAALALEGLPPAEARALAVSRATLLRFQARLEEAQAAYEALVEDPDDPQLAQHLISLGVVLQMRERYPEAMARLSEAMRVADATGQVAAGVRARNFVGRGAIFAGQTGVARTHLRSAVRRAREAGLKGMLAGSLTLYGYMLATKQSSPEGQAEGVACLEEAIRLDEEEGNDYELQDAWTMLGNVHLHAGRLAEARDAISKGLGICRRLNMANETLFGHLNLGACLLELGDLPGALDQATRAVDLARRQGRKFPEGFAVALEGLARLHRGEPVVGLARLQEGLAIAKAIGNKYLELNVSPLVLEGLLYLGRFAEAESLLNQARALAVATKNDEMNPKLDRLELALMVLNYSSRAGLHAEALLQACAGGQAAPLAQALRWEAERLDRAGQAEQALARVREARALAEEAALVLLTAELCLHEGRLLLPVDPAEAAVPFAIALDLGEALGAPVVGAIARAGLAASDPSMSALRAEARSRMDAVTAGLSAAELQDFLAWPARDLAFAAPRLVPGGFSVDRVRHLTELITAISASASLDEVLSQALAALVDLSACDRGFLLLYEGFEVTHRVLHGPQGGEDEAYSATMAYQVLWSGHPIVLEDAMADAQFSVASSVQNLELRFAVGVPIRHGHETLGVMLADSKGLNPDFGADELVIAEALGRQVAVAIRQARELERYRNGHAELQRLHLLALDTIGEPDPYQVMATCAGEALSLTGADRAVVLWGEGLRCLAHFDAQAHRLPGEATEVSSSVAAWVREKLEPLHLMDAQADEAFQSARSVAALGLRTIYAVPLSREGEALGVLYLDMTRMGEPGPGVMRALERLGEFLGHHLAKAGPQAASLA